MFVCVCVVLVYHRIENCQILFFFVHFLKCESLFTACAFHISNNHTSTHLSHHAFMFICRIVICVVYCSHCRFFFCFYLSLVSVYLIGVCNVSMTNHKTISRYCSCYTALCAFFSLLFSTPLICSVFLSCSLSLFVFLDNNKI